MSPANGWPYATKAIFQHEWIINNLSIYVIFKHPMDISVQPPWARWLVKVDGVLKPVAFSAWEDLWTLSLSVLNIFALPGRVTVEYNGPHERLRTTWGKQWEPFGPMPSEDKTITQPFSAGMCVFWYGTLVTIPTGWQNCDGTNGTPDTQGRFPVCVGGGYAKGDTGGAAAQVHTFTSSPHYHTLEDGDEVMEGDYWGTDTDSKTVSGTTDSSDNRPPYFALWFIMKL